MIRKLAAVLSFCLSITDTGANDGYYLSSGGLIYPVDETKISLEKEVLSFTTRDGISTVNIHFEFMNPDSVKRTLLLGFQAPYPGGDVPVSKRGHNQIRNFSVMINGKFLQYKINAAKCDACELTDTSAVVVDENSSAVFVYLFEATFEPGINVINHSYDFPASMDVMTDEKYNYILKTGSKWAGGTIKDLTVKIDMGPNSYFFVQDIFTGKASWKIVGPGKVTDEYVKVSSAAGRMIRILSGYLEINIKDFKPTENIFFGRFRKNSFFSETLDEGYIPLNILRATISLTTDFKYRPQTYTKEELRILRNAIYAQHGLAFRSKDLQDYFNQFPWYIPDPGLSEKNIMLTDREKKFVEEILAKEGKMK